MSQRKRSDDRRQGAPPEPARPAEGATPDRHDGPARGEPGEGPASGEERAAKDGRASAAAGAGRRDGRPEPPASGDRAAPEARGDESAATEAAGEDDRTAQLPGEDDRARLEAERDEYLALAQRTKADFENYRRRAMRDIAAAGVRGKVELARELLPVVDNLERALQSADDEEAGLAEGVRLVHSELVAALERSGVEAIHPGGEPFDPNLHEALTTRAEDGAESGVVLDVVQKGYRLDETVLRPARVVVSA